MIEKVTIEAGSATMSPPTVGMRLDAFIAEIDGFFSSNASVVLAFLTGWLVCFVFIGRRQHLQNTISHLLPSSVRGLAKGEPQSRKMFQWVNVISVFSAICMFCVGANKESHNDSAVHNPLGPAHYILVIFGTVLVYKLIMLPMEESTKKT